MTAHEKAWLIASGAAATLVGVGLGRFAYAALLPGIIEAGWVSEAGGAYLGAANLAGYLAGALIASPLAARLGGGRVIRAGLIAVVLSFALCALPAPFVWFFFWRFLGGVAGAALMVLGPSAVLSALTPEQRKSGAAFVFSGVGLGVLLSATLVPALASYSMSLAWVAVAAAALLPALLTWGRWQGGAARAVCGPDPAGEPVAFAGQRVALAAVFLAYALDAVGFVPHTVFWVDFLSRESGYSPGAAGAFWALFGLAAVAGPFLAGFGARLLGWNNALAAALLLKAFAVALPLASTGVWAAVLSSALMGALVLGVVVLVSGRLAEIAGARNHRAVWGWATLGFAGAQALTAYGFAALYARAGSYVPLFEIAAAALVAASAVAVTAPALQGALRRA